MDIKNSKSIIYFIAVALVLGSGWANGAPLPISNSASSMPRYVADEVLVKYDSLNNLIALSSTMSSMAMAVKPIGNKIQVVELRDNIDIKYAVEYFNSLNGVEYAQPNYIYYPTATTPNDPFYDQLWGLNNSGQPINDPTYATNNPGIDGLDMNLESAWDVRQDCSSVTVAVIDSGVNYRHADLIGQMWNGGASYPNHGWDFADGDNNPLPEADSLGDDHGTHVAATIAATGNNGLGVTGICWKSSVMAVRSGGSSSTTANLIQSMRFAVDNGASIINMSLGDEVPFDQAWSDEIDYARAAGALVVVGAGNGGLDGVSDDVDSAGEDSDPLTKFYPCAFEHDNLICVAAVDQAFELADFSNYGSTSVDISAPGTNILSATFGRVLVEDFTSGWTITSGWHADSGAACGFPALINPSTACTGGTYADNADDRAYKAFPLDAIGGGVQLTVRLFNIETGFDSVELDVDVGAVDPFADGESKYAVDGTLLVPNFAFNLGDCASNTCSLGVRLLSDALVSNGFAGIFDTKIFTVEENTTELKVKTGTSMASPNVAGVAALIWSQNPNYDYMDIRDALLLNGTAPAGWTAGTTASDMVVNADSAIRYHQKPMGLTITLPPVFQ